MGRTIRLIEEITGNKGLTAGISEVSDVELLVSAIPSTTKTAIKRNLGLDEATTDAQLVTLIASEEFGGDGEPFTPVIEPIDIENMQPFKPRTDGGEIDPNVGLIEFLNNPNMQDGYGKGQSGDGEGEPLEGQGGDGEGQGGEGDEEGESKGQGQGEGEGEGDEEGSGSGGSKEDGNGEESEGQGGSDGEEIDGEDESEGEGGSEGRSEEEEQQERVENELLEFGYQSLFMDIKKLLDSVKTEDDDGSFKYLTIDKLDYVDVHKRLYLQSDSLKYEVTVYSNDSIKPQDFQYDVQMGIQQSNNIVGKKPQILIRGVFQAVEKSQGVEADESSYREEMEESEAFDTYNQVYQRMIKQLNKALIKEAERCSKFIENIK